MIGTYWFSIALDILNVKERMRIASHFMTHKGV